MIQTNVIHFFVDYPNNIFSLKKYCYNPYNVRIMGRSTSFLMLTGTLLISSLVLNKTLKMLLMAW